MKGQTWIPVIIGSLFACSGCDSGKEAASARPGVGEQLVVALPDCPKFLTEEMALSAAQVTLDLERLWRTNWHAVPGSHTAAPDGRNDEYLARNGANPNRGIITFTNGSNILLVSVELQSNLLFFQYSPKK